jgi:adenine-specific DNA-methyltransferase
MRVVQDIWHGDSSELGKRFLAKRMIQCVITDPPFGVDNQSNSSVTPDGKKYARKIMNDETPEIAMASFEKVMGTIIPAMKDDSDIYVFTAHQVLEEWLEFTRILFQPFGFTRKAIGMWIKDGPGQGDLQSWGMGCEFILYYKRGKRPGNGKRTNLIFNESQVRPNKLIHPHEKPLELLWKLAQHSTSPGDLLVDPYGGSGSLARMCRLHERSGVSIEGDEYNFKLAKQALDEMEVPLI